MDDINIITQLGRTYILIEVKRRDDKGDMILEAAKKLERIIIKERL